MDTAIVALADAHLRGISDAWQTAEFRYFSGVRGEIKKRLYLHPQPASQDACAKAEAFTGRVQGKEFWRDGRVVDCGGLENRCPGDWTGGSNPSLSADHSTPVPSVTEQVFYFTAYRTGLARVRDDGK